jgi:hypothetical protein
MCRGVICERINKNQAFAERLNLGQPTVCHDPEIRAYPIEQAEQYHPLQKSKRVIGYNQRAALARHPAKVGVCQAVLNP